MLTRPEAGEFSPYFAYYISLVPDVDIFIVLRTQLESLKRMITDISESQALYRYAPDKWTLKEVFGHITDTERIFAYRALRLLRQDVTPLPGFDQDLYVKSGHFNERKLGEIFQEFALLRASNLLLFQSVPLPIWQITGHADDKVLKASVIPFIMAGHVLHHTAVIRERYLPGLLQR